MKGSIELKEKLHRICLELVQEKIDTCNSVLRKINEAKLSDTKSSAGDKFETSREMLQGEEDRIKATLSNALMLNKVLRQIDPTKASSKIEHGAFVMGSMQNYYISVGLGKLEIEGIKYWAISMASPIAKQMTGKIEGDVFTFNGKQHTIEEIF